MKVIQEIIDYLFEHNHLTIDDFRVFEQSGLLAGTVVGACLDEMGKEAEPEIEPRPSDREELVERAEALFDRVADRARKSSRPGLPRRMVERKILSNRLLECFEDGAEVLSGLRVLASAVGPAENLSSTLSSLIGADDEELRQAITAVLRQKDAAFLDLWDAATFREHRLLLGPDEHGPAAVAYRALLEGIAPNALGRYAVELSAPGLSELMRLVNVQNRVLAAIGSLLTLSPSLFDKPLFLRGGAATCYWAMTFTVTASRGEVPPSRAIPLEPAARPFPDHLVLPLVFESAVALSRRTLEALADWEQRRAELVCPPAWNLGGGANWPTGAADQES